MANEICSDIQKKLEATGQVYMADIDMPLSITKGLFSLLDAKRKRLAKIRKIPEVQYDFEDLLFHFVVEDPPEEVTMPEKRFDFTPMEPAMGPPLPKRLNILWPEFMRRRTGLERAARHRALYGEEAPAERKRLGPRMETGVEYARSWLPCEFPGPPIPRWLAVKLDLAPRR